MKININSPLFEGIAAQELDGLLICLNARTAVYQKGDTVFAPDEPMLQVGVVTQGSVLVVQDDFWGNRTVVARVAIGGVFGEALSYAEAQPAPVGVEAAERCEVLLLDSRKLLAMCSDGCEHHRRLIRNVMQSLAVKNLTLMKKMSHISKRTIRDKVLSYLSERSEETASPSFTIPFDRQQLADYLAIDRSALSAVLSRLKRERVIEYDRNRFTLI